MKSRLAVGLSLVFGWALSPRPATAAKGSWQTGGPYAGGETLAALVNDPRTPSTLYAASVTYDTGCAGVLKSTDAGATWFVSTLGIAPTVTLPCMLAIAVDPTSSDVVYAVGRTSALYKSNDAGRTWNDVARGLLPLPGYGSGTALLPPAVLLIDSVTPNTIYLGLFGGGFFKSTDGGVNWRDAGRGFGGFDLNVTAGAIDPTNPAVLYIATSYGIYRSTDASASWTVISTAGDAKALAIDPQNPATVYATAYPGVVIRSSDRGASWTTLNKNFPNHDINDLVLDPAHPAHLYVSTRDAGVFRSTDGGEVWQQANQGFGGTSAADLAATPVGVFAALGRLFRWDDSNLIWSATDVRHAVNARSTAASRAAPRTMYAVTLDSGVYKSVDGGGSWTAANNGLGPYAGRFDAYDDVAVDPVVPTNVYLCTYAHGVYKSFDAGATWAYRGGGFCGRLAIDPKNPSKVYAASTSGVIRSGDGGTTWAASPPGESVTALAIDPVVPSTLFASMAGAIQRSTDSGASWAVVAPGLSAIDLAVDPATPSTLYAAADTSGVFKSTDSGSTWAPINTGLPGLAVLRVAVDETATATLYAATAGAGVYRSDDAGAHWLSFNDGLGSGWVQGLALEPGSATVHAAVGRGGVWRRRAATGAFQTVDPCRAVDTRLGDGPALAAGATRTFKLTGKCGLPDDAGSVSVNITVTGPTGPGHVRVYPGNTLRPTNSSLNFEPGQTRANNAVLLLGAAGDLAVFSGQASGTVHVIVDVNGYFQ